MTAPAVREAALADSLVATSVLLRAIGPSNRIEWARDAADDLRAAAALLRFPVDREALKAAIRQGLREWTLTYQPSENYPPLTIAPLAWLLADNIPPEAFNSVADAILAAMQEASDTALSPMQFHEQCGARRAVRAATERAKERR